MVSAERLSDELDDNNDCRLKRWRIVMNREQIVDRVIKIIKDTLCDDSIEIFEDTYLINDLDMGSMDVLAMMADLEGEFELEIPEKMVQKFVKVSDIVDYIEQNI